MNQVGITERGDPALDLSWQSWVNDGKPAILISKDPYYLHSLLLPHHNIIVHCTITGYGGTIVEPNVPETAVSMEGLLLLGKLLGWDRIVLRVDPIIPTAKGSQIALDVIEQAKKHVRYNLRTRISFMDLYKHARSRLSNAGLLTDELLQLYGDNIHAPIVTRARLLDVIAACASENNVEVCGEPNMVCTGCVSTRDLEILGVEPPPEGYTKPKQREACACLPLKHELLNNREQCEHGCLYCYWQG